MIIQVPLCMGLDLPLVSEDPSWTVCDELLKKP